MKRKINASTRQKQIVEEMLIENYVKYYKLAYSYVRNESDARDIVQEGAYKAILNCSSLKNNSYAGRRGKSRRPAVRYRIDMTAACTVKAKTSLQSDFY